MVTAGLATPRQFYWVLERPAPLAGMAYPRSSPWSSLASAGFRSVACLSDAAVRYDPTPLQVLRAAGLEDLHGGKAPEEPVREASALRDVVAAVVSDLLRGNGVVVHCVGGTGRTGTVIACTLRALGLPVHTVLDYMGELNVARRDRPDWTGWPESEWQLQQVMEWSDEGATCADDRRR